MILSEKNFKGGLFMYCFKKEKTYLELFNETTKRSYDKIGSKNIFFGSLSI